MFAKSGVWEKLLLCEAKQSKANHHTLEVRKQKLFIFLSRSLQFIPFPFLLPFSFLSFVFSSNSHFLFQHSLKLLQQMIWYRQMLFIFGSGCIFPQSFNFFYLTFLFIYVFYLVRMMMKNLCAGFLC